MISLRTVQSLNDVVLKGRHCKLYWCVELLLFPTKMTCSTFDVRNKAPAKMARDPQQAFLVKEWLVSAETLAMSNNVRIEKKWRAFLQDLIYDTMILVTKFWCTSIKIQNFAFFVLFTNFALKCLPLIIAVYRLLDFDQMWILKARIIGITKKRKKYCQKLTFSYMGTELEKGRNLLAETSGGQIRKGPKPLATHSV